MGGPLGETGSFQSMTLGHQQQPGDLLKVQVLRLTPDLLRNLGGEPRGLAFNKRGDSNTALCSLAQTCPTLGDPTAGNPPGSSPVRGILQARTLQRVAISFSFLLVHQSVGIAAMQRHSPLSTLCSRRCLIGDGCDSAAHGLTPSPRAGSASQEQRASPSPGAASMHTGHTCVSKQQLVFLSKKGYKNIRQ